VAVPRATRRSSAVACFDFQPSSVRTTRQYSWEAEQYSRLAGGRWIGSSWEHSGIAIATKAAQNATNLTNLS
jgi:hypothetical protein